MNKTITLSKKKHDLLLGIFSSIADLDLLEHCEDDEFQSLWNDVIAAKEEEKS